MTGIDKEGKEKRKRNGRIKERRQRKDGKIEGRKKEKNERTKRKI